MDIGAGGMREAYCARNSQLRRDIALKILPAAFATDPGRVCRFAQEECAAAPNLRPILHLVAQLEIGDLLNFL